MSFLVSELESDELVTLTRRTFLRATGVSLASPMLELFAPAAPKTAVPRRKVCINTPLGLHPPFFFPQKAGKDYELTPYLEVLKELQSDFTVMPGLCHPDVGHSHDLNFSLLTAAPHPEQRAGFKNSVSLDQFAAEHFHGKTRFSSLPLSCEGFTLSWTRSGAPVPAHSLAKLRKTMIDELRRTDTGFIEDMPILK